LSASAFLVLVPSCFVTVSDFSMLSGRPVLPALGGGRAAPARVPEGFSPDTTEVPISLTPFEPSQAGVVALGPRFPGELILLEQRDPRRSTRSWPRPDAR